MGDYASSTLSAGAVAVGTGSSPRSPRRRCKGSAGSPSPARRQNGTSGLCVDDADGGDRKNSTTTRLSRFIGRLHRRISNNNYPPPEAMEDTAAPVTATRLSSTTSGMPAATTAAAKALRWEPTAYQRDLIQKTWSDDFDYLYELGANIYEYIFDHEPAAKVLFDLTKFGDRWKESTTFRSQALKFVQVIAQAKKNIYNLARVDGVLYQIGARHVDFAARGFKPEYWSIFQAAIQYSMAGPVQAKTTLSQTEKTDAIETWKILADYIVQKMLVGFEETRLKRVAEGHQCD